jgi:hypothetical protein
VHLNLHDLDTPKFDVESNFVIVMIINVEGDFKAYHDMNKGDELDYVTPFTRPSV